jgi:hypothetical protein
MARHDTARHAGWRHSSASNGGTSRGRPPLGHDQMKLYNASSFFDPRAVPEEDYAGVASALKGVTESSSNHILR